MEHKFYGEDGFCNVPDGYEWCCNEFNFGENKVCCRFIGLGNTCNFSKTEEKKEEVYCDE